MQCVGAGGLLVRSAPAMSAGGVHDRNTACCSTAAAPGPALLTDMHAAVPMFRHGTSMAAAAQLMLVQAHSLRCTLAKQRCLSVSGQRVWHAHTADDFRFYALIS